MNFRCYYIRERQMDFLAFDLGDISTDGEVLPLLRVLKNGVVKDDSGCNGYVGSYTLPCKQQQNYASCLANRV